jgi:uncharacterized protein YcnI
MVNPTTFTGIIPAVPSGATGTAVTYTAASASSTGDLIPIAVGAAMTVVLVKNSDAGSTHTATFQTQTDAWGVATTQAVTVPISGTVAVALFPPSRWANTTANNTCAVTYDAYTDLSIAVLQVPWSG